MSSQSTSARPIISLGMDVHKESIDIAIADEKEARHFGRVGGDAASVGTRCLLGSRSCGRGYLLATR